MRAADETSAHERDLPMTPSTHRAAADRCIRSGSIFRSTACGAFSTGSAIRNASCRRSSTSPAPTARARSSLSCARRWKRPAAASMSTPRRIWCGSTSASGLGAPGSGGGSVSDEALAAALEECERANGGEPITVFEIETAAAFLLFSRVPADVVLLEVGLGGRLDATNVIEKPLACAITPVSMDHLEFLGDTLEKIAAEKAAILKRGVPAAIAPQADAVLAVIERQAKRVRAAARRRRALERARRARPSGLSGRRRPARPAAAEARRPPSGRKRRHRHRGACAPPDWRCRLRPSRRASPRPNGRRGCSASRTARSRR